MELITNRTYADVLLGNSKGVYSWEDLNRVEQAVDTLSRQAAEAGIVFQPVVKLDWAEPGAFDIQQWPVQSQMRRYLQNVKNLCSAVGVTARLPQSMEKLTWEGANQIERALLAVYTKLQRTQVTGEEETV
jgi:hypothetical protein